MMPETAKRTARVPILGEDGRISDDYIPAAIGEGVESAEAAATRAETAATSAEGSATAAGQSAAGAQGSASAAGASAAKAQESAATAGGAVTQAQSAQQAAEAAKTGAESAATSAADSASKAQQSATAAADSAASVADKFIASAQATTLEPGSQATASVADQVLTIGVPRGEKGDKGDTGDTGKQGVQGDKGDPGTAATIAVGSVTGLAAGASPTVVNSGTSNAAVLDFGIPKGDKGDKGDPGTTPAVVAAEGSDLSVSTDESTVTIDDSALRARISELEQQTQNVVTGTSTDLVSHGEDAFPQKPREVRVKGKTWVNRWAVINGTNNGVTVSTDETGLITIEGTPTRNVTIVSAVIHTIRPNTKYSWAVTSAVSSNVNDASFAIVYLNQSGNNDLGNNHFGTSLSGVFTSKAFDDSYVVRAEFYIGSSSSLIGQPFSWSGRVMLVDGTEAPDCFTPPASIASVETGNLVTSGKNVLDISGAVKDGWNVALPNAWLVSGETYTYTSPSTAADAVGLFDIAENIGLTGYLQAGKTQTFTVPATCTFKSGIALAGATDSAIVVGDELTAMVELGSTATVYEPPTVTTTPLPEVELRSLPNGTCDELVIKADGSCQVERRTDQIVFDGTQTMNLGETSTYQFVSYNTEYEYKPAGSEYIHCDRFATMGSTANSAYLAMGSQNKLAVIFGFPLGTFAAVNEAEEWFASNPTTVVFTTTTTTTEPQSPVTLPALPAPTFNQYHDSPVPSDTSTEYVRDINLVLANLESVQAALLGGE